MTLTWCSPGRQSRHPALLSWQLRGHPRQPWTARSFKDGSERSFADPVLGANPLEIDPAFVETIDHADAGQRMLHSLRAEERLPRTSRHRFHLHGMANSFSKARRDVVGRIAARPFEFDDA